MGQKREWNWGTWMFKNSSGQDLTLFINLDKKPNVCISSSINKEI